MPRRDGEPPLLDGWSEMGPLLDRCRAARDALYDIVGPERFPAIVDEAIQESTDAYNRGINEQVGLTEAYETILERELVAFCPGIDAKKLIWYCTQNLDERGIDRSLALRLAVASCKSANDYESKYGQRVLSSRIHDGTE